MSSARTEPEPVLAPGSGSRPAPEAGKAFSLLEGKPTDATVTVVDTLVRVQSGSVQLDVTGLSADGSVRRPQPDASLLLDQGGQVHLQATGFTPDGEVVVWGFSTPVLLGRNAVDSQGNIDTTFALPMSMGGGHHTLQVNGPAADGARSISLGLLIDGSGVPVWQSIDHPQVVIATQVAFLALTGVAALGGLSAAAGAAGLAGAGAGAGLGAAARGESQASGGGSRRSEDKEGSNKEGEKPKRKAGKVASVKVKTVSLADSSHARGDLSRTWRLPGSERVDRLGRLLPGKLSRWSPLAARLLTDGVHVRAMFGSAWALLVLTGATTGVVAGLSVGSLPAPALLPAAFAVVLGTMDAFAGMTAATAFLATLFATGALNSPDGVRGALGVAALWFALPLLAGETRPLRRQPTRSRVERWYRAGDFVVLPPLGAWLTYKLVKALPGLYGHSIALSGHAGKIAVIAGGALLLRLIIEETTTWLYPFRLMEVSTSSLPDASTRQKVVSIAIKTSFFAFVAMPFVGVRPELFIGAALFALPQLARLWEKRIPKRSWMHRLLPRGIVKVTALVVVGYYAAQYIGHHFHDHAKLAATGFVALSVPPATLALLALFADGSEGRASWWHRAAGAVTVALSASIIFRLSVA